MNPVFARLIDSVEILSHIKELLASRDIGETISYQDRVFKFTYVSDPNVIFSEDINARSSVLFAADLRKVLEPLNYGLIVSNKGKID